MITTYRTQEGSAYIVTLMVLFLLTIVGLSLTVVTQTEMLIGSQDRVTQRIFYAADAGLGVAVANALRQDELAFSYEVVSQGLTDRVEVSAFIPLDAVKCNLCELNEDRDDFRRVPFAVGVTASRIGKDAGGNPDVVLARKQLSMMVEFLPWNALLIEHWGEPGVIQGGVSF